MTKFKNGFAARLRTLRARANLSKHVLAGRASLSRQQYARLESGRCQPTWATACALADALGVQLEEFRVTRRTRDQESFSRRREKSRTQVRRGRLLSVNEILARDRLSDEDLALWMAERKVTDEDLAACMVTDEDLARAFIPAG